MSRSVQILLPTGEVVWLEARSAGASDVAAVGLVKLDADELRDTVRGLSNTLRGALEELVPDQMQLEFGLELAVKSGKVTSLIAEAGATATIKVTMTWAGGATAPSPGSGV